MSDLAPLLQGFLTDKLMLHSRPRTHRRRLPGHLYPSARLRPTAHWPPARPTEHRRPGRTGYRSVPPAPGNRPRQHHRNARLAAIRSIFRYAALRHPEHAAVIQRVLAIPPKRFDRAIVNYLTAAETDACWSPPLTAPPGPDAVTTPCC